MAKLIPYFTTAEAGKAVKELEKMLNKKTEISIFQEIININCVGALNELLLKNAQEDVRVSALCVFARIFEDGQCVTFVTQYGLLKTFVGKKAREKYG